MENFTKTEVVLFVLVAYLFFRMVKELAWIRLYAFVVKLKADGKLIQENDPNNMEGKTYNELLKQTKSII
jgi:hypothetical protein